MKWIKIKDMYINANDISFFEWEEEHKVYVGSTFSYEGHEDKYEDVEANLTIELSNGKKIIIPKSQQGKTYYNRLCKAIMKGML